MLSIAIRTDKPEAEIALYEDTQQVAQIVWLAHRQLAETLNLKIRELLDSQQKQLIDIQAVVVFIGPGSFTGLRIGISVANALSYGLERPIVGAKGDDWQVAGLKRLLDGENDKQVVPEYGSAPHITAPKK